MCALLKELTREEIKMPGAYIDDIRSIKAKIEAIEIEKYKGATVRARAERLLAGELRALADEKQHARKRDITEIEYNGVTSYNPNVISNAFMEYYRELFAHRVPQKPGFDTEFLHLLPQLSKETTEKLKSKITASEIDAAVNDLKPGTGTSLGPD